MQRANFLSLPRREGSLVYCDDMARVLGGFGKQHDPNEWHIFIKTVMLRFKALMFYKGNKHSSLPAT
jgi:hypothetical protein